MSSGAAGFDIEASEDAQIMPGTIKRISTGLHVSLPPGFELQVRGRSGIAFKAGVECFNSPGTVDSDYRGAVSVILFNASSTDVFIVRKGDRIAQGIISPVFKGIFINDWENLSYPTDRAEKGFGSTEGVSDFEKRGE
jgi:dUTP pyrophosphatase